MKTPQLNIIRYNWSGTKKKAISSSMTLNLSQRHPYVLTYIDEHRAFFDQVPPPYQSLLSATIKGFPPLLLINLPILGNPSMYSTESIGLRANFHNVIRTALLVSSRIPPMITYQAQPASSYMFYPHLSRISVTIFTVTDHNILPMVDPK